MRLTRNFKLAWNGFFLLTALFFCSLTIMVFYFPATLNDFAESHKQSYLSLHQKMAEQALSALKQGNNQPTQDLLNKDLSKIKKGDRLFPIKRHLLFILVQQLHSQNTDLSWVTWAKKWYQLDDRDVTAMAYYFAALLQDDRHHAEGLRGLKIAVQRFPQHPLLTRFYQAETSRSAKPKD